MTRARLRHAERLTNLHGGGLQPIDTDRLLVADLVLKTDVDILVCFQHLLGGLREAGFIAVERRNLEEAWKKGDKRECHEQRRRTPVRADGIVERRSQSSRRSKGRPCLIGTNAHVFDALNQQLWPDNRPKPRPLSFAPIAAAR